MILALMIVAGSDKYNMAPPQGLLPLIVFLVLLGLGVAHGMQTCKYYVNQWLLRAVKSDAINFFSVCFQSSPWFRSTPPPLFCGVRKATIYLQKVIASFKSIISQGWRNLFFQSILALVSNHCAYPWCTSWDRFLWFIPQATRLSWFFCFTVSIAVMFEYLIVTDGLVFSERSSPV